MLNRLMVLMTIATALVAVDAPPAAAQEVQVTGPLAGEPAVRHMRLYRKGRLQLAPVMSFTLQDEFSRTFFVGAQVGYHFLDWLGVSLWGAFGVAHLDTDLTDQVQTKGTTRDRNALSLPSADFFPNQVGEINWATALQVNFIPLRGKLALFQKVFVDADFLFFAGVAAVGIEERANVENTTVCDAAPPAGTAPDPNAAPTSAPFCVSTQQASDSRIAIAPTFGVGLNLYVNDWIAILLEWRGLPFEWNTSGFDIKGNDGAPDQRINADDREFHFNHMVSVGASFFLPTDVEVSD